MTDYALEYNVEEAYEEPPIPEGNYGVEIRGAEMVESKGADGKAKRPGLRVDFIITDSGDVKGRYLNDTLWMPVEEDRGQPFGKKNCDKFEGMLGMIGEKIKKVDGGSYWEGNFSTDNFIESAAGEALVVKVTHQTTDQHGEVMERPREEVQKWYKVQQ